MVVCVDGVAKHRIVQSLVYAVSVVTVIFESAGMLVSVVMVIVPFSKGFVPCSCHCIALLERVCSNVSSSDCKSCALEC